MDKFDYSEVGAALRHARVQLGWSQELFAEKALLSPRTIMEAESGRRIYPRTFRLMLDAINKERAAARPPAGPLVLEYPSPPKPGKAVSVAEEPKAAAHGLANTALGPATVPEALGESLAAEEPLPVDPPRGPAPLAKGDGDPPQIAWLDDQPLIHLGEHIWRLRDACQGTVIFGATGSGKTSGSGQALARALLDAQFGGLVLCAKPGEANLWIDYAKAKGREADLVLFGRDPNWTFNFLEHESRRQGAGANLTENLVNLFTEIASIGAGSSGSSSSDPFWERAMKSLVRNCVDLLYAAGAPITLHNMFEVVRSAPHSLESIHTEAWKSSSACWQYLDAGKKTQAGSGARIDFHEVASYWLDHFPALGERTRSSIVALFLTLSEGLMRSKMRELFCSGTTIAPEDILAGKIVIVDLPVKEWGEIGRISAVLWKYCFQKTVERRKDNEYGQARPVFLWADECQYFFSRHDSLFQATARSSRAATVYLTQSIPTLVAAVGGEAEARSLVDSVLNNLVTKIFHANGDQVTNEFAANLIGKMVHRFRNQSRSVGPRPSGRIFPAITDTHGYSEQLGFIIQPHEFSRMRRGGPENSYLVECCVVQIGNTFPTTRQSWMKAAFSQRRDPVPSAPSAPRVALTGTSVLAQTNRDLPAVTRLLFPWVRRKKVGVFRWLVFVMLWIAVLTLVAPFVAAFLRRHP